MSAVKVDEIFNHAFVSVTKKLTSVELDKDTGKDAEDDIKYKELVYTKGKFNSTIICEFSDRAFKNIVSAMYGGNMPPDDMQILYINEYVNIVCGRALSEINNITGVSARLTVPSFYRIDEKIKDDEKEKSKFSLEYKTDYGMIKVSVYYIFEK